MKKVDEEKIQSNVSLLEKALEGWKEELEFTEKLRDKYFDKYDNSREDSTIADALTCYLGEIREQVAHAEKVIIREKAKLESK